MGKSVPGLMWVCAALAALSCGGATREGPGVRGLESGAGAAGETSRADQEGSLGAGDELRGRLGDYSVRLTAAPASWRKAGFSEARPIRGRRVKAPVADEKGKEGPSALQAMPDSQPSSSPSSAASEQANLPLLPATSRPAAPGRGPIKTSYVAPKYFTGTLGGPSKAPAPPSAAPTPPRAVPTPPLMLTLPPPPSLPPNLVRGETSFQQPGR